MKLQKFVIGCCICSLAAVTIPAAAGDWTDWRGPDGDGHSPETAWSPTALADGPKIMWEANVGKGHSAVAVSGGRVFTMGVFERKRGGTTIYEDLVTCLDEATGKTLWKYAYPSADIEYPGPRSTPVLDGNRVFTISWQGQLFCFDAATGKVEWKKDLLAEGLTEVPFRGIAGSPVVVGNSLLVAAGASGLAVDKRNGKVLWSSEPAAGGLTSPVLYQNNGRQMAIFSGATELHGVDVANGKVAWSHGWQTYNDPIPFGSKMFLSGSGRGSALLDITGDKAEVVWQERLVVGGFSNGVIIDGLAYVFGNVRRKQPLQCVDVASGELKWSEDLGAFGSLMATDGKLIILTGEGELIVAESSGDGFKPLSRTKVMQMRDNTGVARNQQNYCWTAPVLANGRVYARDNDGDLVCLDMTAPAAG